MSSHHIVREKQEPALLVLSLREFSYELLGQLLEWSPTLIATPESAIALHNDQIKIDWLTANETIDELQSDVKLIPVTADDYLETALNQLINLDYRAVNIITTHFNETDYLPYTSRIDLVIYCGDEKIYPIKPGFSKWKPAGDEIRMVSKADGLAVSGLNPTGKTTFETAADGFFSLSFTNSHLFIAERV